MQDFTLWLWICLENAIDSRKFFRKIPVTTGAAKHTFMQNYYKKSEKIIQYHRAEGPIKTGGFSPVELQNNHKINVYWRKKQ